jgi:CubicO group peptidase (beta-lactamase class C family)
MCLYVFLCAFSAIAQNNVELLDKYIESARKQWNVPGLSVTVVQDGKVLLAKGYGVRELGKSDAVDGKTLFGAMSTTKAMTVVALGMLVDEGKVNWDDKVIKHLPGFRVADPYVTNDLRVRDLLTHNGGLGNADFLWAWTPEMPADKVVSQMQYAKQAYPLRGGYTYQNIMYLVAGQVVEKVSRMSWEKFMIERLFKPLGMNDSFPNYEYSKNYQNRSIAHYEYGGKIQTIPEMTADPIGPAGSVWSTPEDIAKWTNFMLGNTKANGKELLKAATLKEMLKPQIIVPPGSFYPTVAITKPNWTTYGLGWFQHDYHGEMINFHTGSLSGRTAIIGLIADKKLGVYIFGNLDHAEVRHALMYKVFDLFAFNDNSRDWSTEFKKLYDDIKEKGEKRAAEVRAKRVLNTKPSLPLEAYAGKYSDPFYGTMDVTLENGKLKLTVSKNLTATFDHWQFDTFEAKWSKGWWDPDLIKFELSPVGSEVTSMNLDGVVLKRVPAGEKK